MNTKNVLICGYKSFAAEGLAELFVASGYTVDCFTRGPEKKSGNCISGDVYSMHTNKFLEKEYDFVINFIIIKNDSIDNNIKYMESFHKYCNKQAKTVLHISSISVYKNDEKQVNETSEIENDSAKKGSYAAIKVECDRFLLKQQRNYNLSFLRPGFIISPKNESSTAGICIKLPFNFAVLLGNKKTSLPLIDRYRMHEAIVKIVASTKRLDCYLLLENRNETKISFLKKTFKGKIITLPYQIIFPLALVLNKIKVLNKTQFWQIKGLFKSTYFDSSATESSIEMSLSSKSICIIGSGVYGSYSIKTINDKYPNASITLLEFGDATIRDEKAAGFSTNLVEEKYSGLSNGRFFGFGGTSNKWGGQLLFFSKNDFKNPTQFLTKIIEITNRYKSTILKKFNVDNETDELWLNDKQFSKTGLWLGYFNRNLFKYFKINKFKNVILVPNCRVTKLISKDDKIVAVETQQGKKIKTIYFDYFMLTAGAFESNRILLQSGLVKDKKIYFSDHLSQRVFKIFGDSKIGNLDLKFKVSGSALITKRIIGEIDNYSYYANPIYNADFPFFQSFKKLLFKREINGAIIRNILFDLPYVFKFFYYMAFKKEVYIYKNCWNIFIDIENPKSNSYIELCENNGESLINDLNVCFTLDKLKIKEIYEKAIDEVRTLLDQYNIKYEFLYDDFSLDKIEDTYHPYNMTLSNLENLDAFYTAYNSLLVINTGILPRAGGINTTAAIFPLIDNYVDNILFKNN